MKNINKLASIGGFNSNYLIGTSQWLKWMKRQTIELGASSREISEGVVPGQRTEITQSRSRGYILEAYERGLPDVPRLSSAGRGWKDVLLRRHDKGSGATHIVGQTIHRVFVQISPDPVYVEHRLEGRKGNSWSGPAGCGVLPAGVPATWSFKGRSDFFSIGITCAVVEEVAADVFGPDTDKGRLTEGFAVPDPTLLHFARLFQAECENPGFGTPLYVDSLSRALALHLLRGYSSRSPRTISVPAAMPGWRLKRALDFIHAHLAEDLTLAQLAGVAGLGPTQFARAFRAAVGEPPYRYLTRLRVEHARHLLEHTRLPVTDIAFQCGFDQPGHFATMFRKMAGLTPLAYRKARTT